MTLMKASLLVACLLAAQQAGAVGLWCNGNVDRIYVDSGSRMYILASYRGDYTMICSLSADWQGITPDVCKSWFAMLQGAYHAQTPVIVYYDSPYASCADIPNYGGAPAPGYVMNRD